MQVSSDTAVQPCEVREVMWMAARVGLRYSAMVWLVKDVAVDDLAIKTPWLVNVAST